MRAGEKRGMSGDSQTSNSVLLVRPASFGFHAEAAASNAFANAPGDADVQRRRSPNSKALRGA